MKKGFLILLALLLALLPCGALAARGVVQPGEDFYYLDTANVLSQETEGLIYFSNQLLERECGAQIVVAALDSIGNADIFEYAVELGNEWGIGSAEENNGFLLLMAIEEDDYYAVTGSGIDGIFPASTIKELYDDYLEADFAAKDYDSGARKFFTAVFERIADYYNADVSIRDGEKAYQDYISRNANAASFGGAQGGSRGRGGEHVYVVDGYYEEEEDFSVIGFTITLIVIIALVSALSGGRRRRGGNSNASAFWLGAMMGSRNHHHHHHHGPRPGGRRPPRPPRSGGFGGGGGRSFGGGGFGGGRSGGGGGFGGGAGRGRH